jgi:hypothetical protein
MVPLESVKNLTDDELFEVIATTEPRNETKIFEVVSATAM